MPENIVIIPKTLGEIIRGLTRQQLNFLEGVCPTTSGITVTQYFNKKRVKKHLFAFGAADEKDRHASVYLLDTYIST